jgi:hypothetical protein
LSFSFRYVVFPCPLGPLTASVARRGDIPQVFTSMWDKIQVVTEVMLLAVAIWLFAATYEPLRSLSFGRPVSHRVAIAIRVTAGLAVGLCLVVLLWDILFR